MELGRSDAPETLKALGDPIRWAIIQEMSGQRRLAGSALEDSLPISRPTISYHIRILTQAGLIEVSKEGRNHFYSLRQDVVRGLIDELRDLLPALRALDGSTTRPELSADTSVSSKKADEAVDDAGIAQVLPTW